MAPGPGERPPPPRSRCADSEGKLGIGTRPKSCTLEGSCLSIPLLLCQVVSAMRAELRRALSTRHSPVHNHARAKVAPACARLSRRPPAQKMHAEKKVVEHTLLFLLGACGDEESPNSGGAVARRRGAPTGPQKNSVSLGKDRPNVDRCQQRMHGVPAAAYNGIPRSRKTCHVLLRCYCFKNREPPHSHPRHRAPRPRARRGQVEVCGRVWCESSSSECGLLLRRRSIGKLWGFAPGTAELPALEVTLPELPCVPSGVMC